MCSVELLRGGRDFIPKRVTSYEISAYPQRKLSQKKTAFALFHVDIGRDFRISDDTRGLSKHRGRVEEGEERKGGNGREGGEEEREGEESPRGHLR